MRLLPWVPPLQLSVAPPLGLLSNFAAYASEHAVVCSKLPGSTQPGAESLPPRWYVSEHRKRVGRGKQAYERAKLALTTLECMQLDWLRITVEGDVLAICSRQFFLAWVCNANRFLQHAAGHGSSSSSVTWATTNRHVLAGEETLSVELDEASGEVYYRILSYSRPRHVFSWLTYPYVIAQQRRFARDSTRKMRDLCATV